MKNRKISSIQGLRAVSFLAIFLSHTKLGDFSCFGAWGVSVFFILSGFLMMISHLNKNDNPKFGFAFAWNKIRQLYPLHIIMMLMAAVYSAYCGHQLVKIFEAMVLNSLLIETLIPNCELYFLLNGPSWYLCTAFFIYLCFPFIYKVCKKNYFNKPPHKAVLGLLTLILIDFLISVICFFFAPQESSAWFTTKWVVYYSPLVRIIDFSVGCLAGCLFFENKAVLETKAAKVSVVIAEIINCTLILLSLILYTKQYGVLGSQAFRYSLLFVPTSTLLICLTASNKGMISRILANGLLVKTGDISPYTFLLHGVVIKYCYLLFQILRYDNKILETLLSFVLTIVSALIWKYLYEFALAKTNRIFSR